MNRSLRESIEMKRVREKILVPAAVILVFFALATFVLSLIDPRKTNSLVPTEDRNRQNRALTPIPPLRKIIFFNEFYSQYSSRLPADRFLSTRFHADLPGLALLEGEKLVLKHGEKTDVSVKGEKITWCVWADKTTFNKCGWDWIEMELQTKSAVDISFYVIPRPAGFADYLRTVYNEGIKRKPPRGSLIFQTALTAKDMDEFETIAFPLNIKEKSDGGTIPPAGILIKIIPRLKSALDIKLKHLEFINRSAEPSEGWPSLGYYKYGGADRYKMNGVFVPAGSTLTYFLPLAPDSNREMVLDGYLGSVGEKPLTLKIWEDQNLLIAQSTDAVVSRFKSEFQSKADRLKVTLQVEGPPGAVAVIGNLSFFHSFPGQGKRNIVIYLVDALRADMGGAPEELFQSHFKDGAVFTSAYANATFTAYSIPALFSGQYTYTLIGKNGDSPILPKNMLLLGKYLKSKGYTTAAFINNPWLDHTHSAQGFDFIFHCWSPSLEKASPFPSLGFYMGGKYGEMENFIRRFAQENGNKPVFIYIHTMEPHIPYEIPLEKRKYSAGADRRVLGEIFEKVTQSLGYPDFADPTRTQLLVLKAMYKDDVRMAYDFFQRVNRNLADDHILDSSSLCILAADHGERFYEHRSWIHGPPDMYQEVLRIPLMVKGAGIPPGVFAGKVQLTDVFPTIMDWLGDPPLARFVGRSLRESIRTGGGNAGTDDHFIYADGAGDFPHYACIEGNIKVIVRDKEIEVYNLEKDPRETVDLSRDPRYRQAVDRARLFRRNLKIQSSEPPARLSEQERERLKSLGYIR